MYYVPIECTCCCTGNDDDEDIASHDEADTVVVMGC